MFCTNCGKHIPLEYKFCVDCGAARYAVQPQAPAYQPTPLPPMMMWPLLLWPGGQGGGGYGGGYYGGYGC